MVGISKTRKFSSTFSAKELTPSTSSRYYYYFRYQYYPTTIFFYCQRGVGKYELVTRRRRKNTPRTNNQ